MKTFYQILGVSPDAEPDVIDAAHRALARKYHPDKPGGSAERMRVINEAHDVLSDPKKREAYDFEIKKENIGKKRKAPRHGHVGAYDDVPPNGPEIGLHQVIAEGIGQVVGSKLGPAGAAVYAKVKDDVTDLIGIGLASLRGKK